ASGSQPSGNTKKDRIQQTQCRAKKNKLEAYSRNVRTSLQNKKSVVNIKDIASVPNSKLNVNSNLQCATFNGCLFPNNHDSCVLEFINSVNASVKLKSAKKPLNKKIWKPTGKVFTNIGYKWRPTGKTFTIVGNVCPLTRITTTAIVALRKPIPLESNTSKPVVTLVYSRKPKESRNNVPVSKSKINKSLSADKKEPNKSQGSTISNVPSSSTVECRQGLVRGLPKLKFEKDHLCSTCAMGKSKKKYHKPKSKDTNQEKLYLLHMDLYGPMRVESVNGKKYILVIVDDYSRFILVKCLRSKDEALDFIIKFLKMIQVRLKVPVRRIRTDNGTEFVNQTLRKYYEQVASLMKHQLLALHKAVATACYTQNQSIVRLRHDKTPYELLHNKLLDLSFLYVFAMQEELNEFERLKVWELVPRPNKVMVITLKWIYKVKLDELGGILKNKARLVARGYRQEKYGFESYDPVDTPMVEKSKLDEDKERKAVDPSHYRGSAYRKALTCEFADADHAGFQDTRRSTSGSLQFLGDRLISWSSKRKNSVAISSTEAEYIALSKHIDIRYHFIKEHVENGVIELYFVNTEYQLADIFTKALGRERIEFLINKLGTST
nr:hypothetical protein [Tanacetum cinerariifolium]